MVGTLFVSHHHQHQTPTITMASVTMTAAVLTAADHLTECSPTTQSAPLSRLNVRDATMSVPREMVWEVDFITQKLDPCMVLYRQAPAPVDSVIYPYWSQSVIHPYLYLREPRHRYRDVSFSCWPCLPWLGLFKYLNQCHCPGWRYLNIYIRVTALAGGI